MISYKDLRSQPRLDLAALSPIPAPLTIYVEPTNVCNFGCQMCPETLPDYKERAGYYQAMDFTVFEKIVADIRAMGGITSLKLYFEGEPLLNKRLADMVRLGKSVAKRVEVTTNGSLLTEQRAKELVESGLDFLQVSIYSVLQSGHFEITGQSKFPPDVILHNVRQLIHVREELGASKPFVHAKLMWDSAEGRKAFDKQYQEVVDEISVQASHNWMGDIKAANPEDLVNIGQAPVHEKRVCPFPFYMMTIKANADVSVCCVDWSGKLKVGNVIQQSLKEIWEGDALQQIRIDHLLRQRHVHSACANCDALYTTTDNLDSLAPEEYLARCR